jgi:hypothetical protein
MIYDVAKIFYIDLGDIPNYFYLTLQSRKPCVVYFQFYEPSGRQKDPILLEYNFVGN